MTRGGLDRRGRTSVWLGIGMVGGSAPVLMIRGAQRHGLHGSSVPAGNSPASLASHDAEAAKKHATLARDDVAEME
jgi:hypothetical protein